MLCTVEFTSLWQVPIAVRTCFITFCSLSSSLSLVHCNILQEFIYLNIFPFKYISFLYTSHPQATSAALHLPPASHPASHSHLHPATCTH
jgi:hypothetical protein